MKNLLLKEFKLCILPINYIFLTFAVILIIPNYPCYVSFFYLLLNTFWIFKNGDLNKDLQYSLILPIRKSDIVKARIMSVAIYEIVFFILSIPFAILNHKLVPQGNNAGINSNFAFYGLVMIVLTISRYFFFTIYYKKAEKHERALLISFVIFFVLYFIFECPVWMIKKGNLQSLAFIDKFDLASLIKQLPILITGIIVYFLGWILTYKVSAKKFEQVNL
jgi:small-conductance mechanosensitive channel